MIAKRIAPAVLSILLLPFSRHYCTVGETQSRAIAVTNFLKCGNRASVATQIRGARAPIPRHGFWRDHSCFPSPHDRIAVVSDPASAFQLVPHLLRRALVRLRKLCIDLEPRGIAVHPFKRVAIRLREPRERVKSCTMIINDANDFVREVHDRMPVVLEAGDFDTWLTGGLGTELLKPAANDVLQKWPVSKPVNSSPTSDEDATLIDRIELAAADDQK